MIPVVATTSGGLIPGWAVALAVIAATLPIVALAADSIVRWRR